MAYPNKDTFLGRPTQACILDLKNWFRSRISELSWNLFRITLCAFNTLPSFCHGNYRSETIIYNSGTRISDKGFYSYFIWVQVIWGNDSYLNYHHCKPSPGMLKAYWEHGTCPSPCKSELEIWPQNSFCWAGMQSTEVVQPAKDVQEITESLSFLTSKWSLLKNLKFEVQ